MKLTKYFMPFAALALLASCSNDKLDGPSSVGESTGEGMYMTLSLTQSIMTSSRSATGQTMDTEEGMNFENFINEALVVFVYEGKVQTSTKFSTFYSTPSNNITDKTYRTRHKMTDEELTALFNIPGVKDDDEVDFEIFVVANPNDVTYGPSDTEVQKPMSITKETLDKYWKNNNFLMSGKATAEWSISKEELLSGKYATEATALDITNGTPITVVRDMARFDMNIKDVEFSFDENGLDENDKNYSNKEAVNVEFVAMTLFNISDKFMLYKQVAEYNEEGTALEQTNPNPDMEFFGKEYVSWNDWKTAWVVDGTWDGSKNGKDETSYKNFINPNFEYNEGATKHQVAPADLTGWRTFEKMGDQNLVYGDIDEVTDLAKNTTWENYEFYGYATPNTILDRNKQMHGNSTGVCFQAILSGDVFENANGVDVYAINNIVVGTYSDVVDMATDESYPEDIRSAVKAGYNRALAALEDGTEPNEANMKPLLVKNGFTIYSATIENESDPVYYCYYYYYNQHNASPSIMGAMEFAVVHNNVYKLAINTVKKLGHPENPEDDPDPDTPDTPDESVNPYLTVDCQVLPWTVRINNIDF